MNKQKQIIEELKQLSKQTISPEEFERRKKMLLYGEESSKQKQAQDHSEIVNFLSQILAIVCVIALFIIVLKIMMLYQ